MCVYTLTIPTYRDGESEQEEEREKVNPGGVEKCRKSKGDQISPWDGVLRFRKTTRYMSIHAWWDVCIYGLVDR